MNRPEVVIVDTGSANLASVAAALDRLDARVHVSNDASRIRDAPLVVLPGVGAFGPAMDRLRAGGLDAAVRNRVQRGHPLLAICLGMQLLCEGSEECKGVIGLSVAPGLVRRFQPPARVPQMGWNMVTPTPGAALLQAAAMYFANSYRLECIPAGWAGATSDFGGTFASALERGPVLACQFHPELSGEHGLQLIGRWLALGKDSEGGSC